MFHKALGIAVMLAFAAQAPAALSQSSAEPATPDPAIAVAGFPAPLSDTVTDLANVLDPGAEGRISALLQGLRDDTGVQMVVVTLPLIEDFGGTGMRLDAYAKALFNAWGVGGAERSDGILMLVVTEPREVRIALGAGYDAVYDGRAARVLATAVLPAFRAGRLAEGIEAGIASTRDRLVTPFLEGRPVTVTEGFEPEIMPGNPWALGAGVLAGGALWILWRVLRRSRRCPRCGAAALSKTREMIEPPTLLANGTGIEHIVCTNCGYVGRKSYTIRRSVTIGRTDSNRSDMTGGNIKGGGAGRDAGGGSGGYGGGRSAGGGASGKW